jgi:MacB-like periplasmic core domain
MSLFRRISNVFSRSNLEQELNAEIKSHLEMRIEDNIAAGMSPNEARRNALLRFGNPTVVRERATGEDVALMLEIFAFNIRYALRQFGRNRAFAVTVILTISLGIGLNTAMFSVIRAVLLEPLGYRDPDRLVLITDGATPIRFDEMVASNRSYDGLGAYARGREDLALSGDGQPEVLKGARVSGNFLEILGVSPLLGRSFFLSEDKPDAPTVAMISRNLWDRRFGGESSVIGKSITLAGMSCTIIGVMGFIAKFVTHGAEAQLSCEG